jgi:predicted nucleic acid-binding protein
MERRRPLVFDTSVYVAAIRDGSASAASLHLQANLPWTYLASVVAAELRAGTITPAARRAVDRFGRRARAVGRVVTPTASSWDRAGDTLARIRAQEPHLRSKVTRLWNDVLIALCARQIGARVITCNARDFRLIRRYVIFDLAVLARSA